jgi:hypothetical protein
VRHVGSRSDRTQRTLARVRKVNPKSVRDVKADVEKYFSELGFSVLKAESDRLTTGQRAAFIRNVFEDVK